MGPRLREGDDSGCSNTDQARYGPPPSRGRRERVNADLHMPYRKDFTYADMDLWLNERQVTEIECLVPDLTGVARGKILPRAKFAEERGMRIPEAVLGMTVTGNYPSDDAAYLRAISTTDRDMMLKADPATITMVPWAQDPTAQVIHDCYFSDGTLVDFAPRSVLRRVLKLYAGQGWAPLIRPEVEFYAIRTRTSPSSRRSGAAGAPKPAARSTASTRSMNSIRCSKTSTTIATPCAWTWTP